MSVLYTAVVVPKRFPRQKLAKKRRSRDKAALLSLLGAAAISAWFGWCLGFVLMN